MINKNTQMVLTIVGGVTLTVAATVAAGVWALSLKFDQLRLEIKQDMAVQKSDADRLHDRVNQINSEIQQEIGGVKDRIGKAEGQLSRISAEADEMAVPESPTGLPAHVFPEPKAQKAE